MIHKKANYIQLVLRVVPGTIFFKIHHDFACSNTASLEKAKL